MHAIIEFDYVETSGAGVILRKYCNTPSTLPKGKVFSNSSANFLFPAGSQPEVFADSINLQFITTKSGCLGVFY